MDFPRRTAVALLALVALAPELPAQDRAARSAGTESPQRPPPGVLRLLPPDAVSDKQVSAGGRTIAYTATAGTFPLFDQNGEQSAAVFYTAYAAKGADAASR